MLAQHLAVGRVEPRQLAHGEDELRSHSPTVRYRPSLEPIPGTPRTHEAAHARECTEDRATSPDAYVERYAALDPIGATFAGIAGSRPRAHRLLPRRGAASAPTRPRHARARSTAATRTSDRDRIAAGVMRERLETRRSLLHEHGEDLRDRACSAARSRRSASASTSWPTRPTTTGRSSPQRMARVPESLASLAGGARARASRAGSSRRAARRSAASSRPRCGAATTPTTRPFFLALADRLASRRRRRSLHRSVDRARPSARPPRYARARALPPRRVRAARRPSATPSARERYAL